MPDARIRRARRGRVISAGELSGYDVALVAEESMRVGLRKMVLSQPTCTSADTILLENLMSDFFAVLQTS
jgi:hypothetical protein